MWSFVLAETDGTELGEITSARSRQLTRRLDRADEATVSLSGRSDVGEMVGEGLDQDLVVYRDGERVFRGRIDAPHDSMRDDHEVTLRARSYRDLLALRHLEASASWTTVEQEAIAWSLIDTAQGLSGGDLGVTRGADQATGVTRSRQYEVGAQVQAKIDDLAKADDGFDWDIDSDLVFRVWYPARGDTRQRVLHYAAHGGNVRRLSRTPDLARFATVVIATASGALSPEIAVSSDVATRGRWSHVEGVSDADSATTLQEAAAGLLGDRETLRAAWTAELSRAHPWGGPDDFDVGDSLRLVVQSGRFDTERVLRVQTIGVSIDASDVETTTVDLDRPSPDLARALRRHDDRLSDLER